MQDISLRPYNGRLVVVRSKQEYERWHKKLYGTPNVLNCAIQGRMAGGEGEDGIWCYLVFADNAAIAAHELCHVLLHVFERCGIEPGCGNGEPFCYMLSQLMIDAGF